MRLEVASCNLRYQYNIHTFDHLGKSFTDQVLFLNTLVTNQFPTQNTLNEKVKKELFAVELVMQAVQKDSMYID